MPRKGLSASLQRVPRYKGTTAKLTKKPRYGGGAGTTLQSRTAGRAKRLGLEVKESYSREEARNIRTQLARRRGARQMAAAQSVPAPALKGTKTNLTRIKRRRRSSGSGGATYPG